MPDFLNRAKGALMLDAPVQNIKSTARTFIAHGPLRAIVDGSDVVWNTNMQRIDGVVGTRLASGGPVQ